VLDLAFRGEAPAELLLAPAAGVLADVDGEGPRELGAAAPVARATSMALGRARTGTKLVSERRRARRHARPATIPTH
jgi:hypothetical protein